MDKSIKILNSFIKYHKWRVLSFLILLCVYVLVNWDLLFLKFDHSFIEDFFSFLILRGVNFLAYLFKNPILMVDSYTYNLQSIPYQIISSSGTYFPYLVAYTALFTIIKHRLFLKFFVILTTSIFLLARAVLINYINIYLKGQLISVWMLEINPMVYLPMVLLVYTILTRNKFLHVLYQNFETIFKEKFNVSSIFLICLVLFIPPLPRIFLRYIDSSILESFITSHLLISSWIVETFSNLSTVVSGRYMFIGVNWISLQLPCIGIGVMSIVLVLVNTYRSPVLNKIIYSLLFTFSFIIMNSVRLALLLVYIYKTTGTKALDRIYLHDFVTYIMYLFALFAFMYYVLRFSEFRISSKLSKENLSSLFNV